MKGNKVAPEAKDQDETTGVKFSSVPTEVVPSKQPTNRILSKDNQRLQWYKERVAGMRSSVFRFVLKF